MTTSPVTNITNGIQDFVKCCIKSWVHLSLQPNNMLFGRLQPPPSHRHSTHHCLYYTICRTLNGSTMRDRSSDPLHYEQTLYTSLSICLLTILKVYIKRHINSDVLSASLSETFLCLCRWLTRRCRIRRNWSSPRWWSSLKSTTSRARWLRSRSACRHTRKTWPPSPRWSPHMKPSWNRSERTDTVCSKPARLEQYIAVSRLSTSNIWSFFSQNK